MACDPDFADVTLLVHMTGANGSTVFTDSSSLANAVTAVGGADIDTSTFQYGTGSLSIDAGSGYFNSSSPPPVNMVGLTSPIVGASANDIITGGGDFTIECWFNYAPAAQAAFQIPLTLFNYGASTYGGLAGFEASVNQTSLYILPMSAWSGISAVISIVAGTWHHFAICRAGAVATMYLDGVSVGTANNWNNVQGAEPSSVTIGCSPFDSGAFGTGWIDEFRITKGLARYASNFAPPSTLFGGVCTGNIPDVVGDVLATGEAAIVAAGFVTGTVTYATDLSVPVGDIISQNPGAGPAILGVAVNLVVSLGLPSETVPNIVGDTQAAAEAAITAAVLDVGTVTTAYSITVPAGDVVSQSVPAGTPVLAYTPISFVVSLGPVLSSLQTNLVSDSAVLGGVFGGALNVAEFTYYPMRPCGSGIVSLGTLLLLPGGAPLEMPGGAPVLLQSNDANIVLPEPTVPNMIINRYKQQPGETKIRGIDFTLLCVPGEVIESVEVSSISPQTDPPLVVTQILVDPVTQQIFAYYVGGGVDGTEYLVEFVVTFNSGDVELEEVIFDISILSEAIYP